MGKMWKTTPNVVGLMYHFIIVLLCFYQVVEYIWEIVGSQVVGKLHD
jgi:hypothetical protein